MQPNFLVIGAARSGTTWIAKNLGGHPEIYVPFKKELHFFDISYDKGMEFYEAFFSDVGDATAIGEATPAYLHKAEVAARIKKHLPNVKLIVSLRNPVDRLYSRYWKSRGRYMENSELSFEEKVAQKPAFIEEGYYVDHLNRFLEYFPRKQLQVLLFDNLASDPGGFMADIYRFIGVSDEHTSQLISRQINAGSAQKLVVKSRSIYLAGKMLDYAGLHGLARKLETGNSAILPEMAKDTRRHLVDIYYEKNRQLEDLIGKDLSHWNAGNPGE